MSDPYGPIDWRRLFQQQRTDRPPEEGGAPLQNYEQTLGPVGSEGNRPLEPGSADVGRAAWEDRDVRNAMLQEDYLRRTGALDELYRSLGGLGRLSGLAEDEAKRRDALTGQTLDRTRNALDTGQRNAASWLDQARGDLRSGLTGAETAIGQGVDRATAAANNIESLYKTAWGSALQKVLRGFQGIDQAGQFTQDAISTVQQQGREALSSFRDQTANMMGEWMAGSQENLRVNKERTAAEMRARGMRPDEIETELKKMDLQASQQQASQLAQFQQYNETTRAQLRTTYDSMTTQTINTGQTVMANLAGLGTDLAKFGATVDQTFSQGIAAAKQWAGETAFQGGLAIGQARLGTAQQLSSVDQVHAELDKWHAGATAAAEQMALTTMMDTSNNLMNVKTAAETAKTAGMQSWAGMWQSNRMEYSGAADVVATLFGLNQGILSNYFGGQMQQFINQANSISNLSNSFRGAGEQWAQFRASRPIEQPNPWEQAFAGAGAMTAGAAITGGATAGISALGGAGLAGMAAKLFVCFGFYTRVQTPRGPRIIGQIEPGDSVLTRDGWATVKEIDRGTFAKPTPGVEIHVGDTKLVLTGDHLVRTYVDGKPVDLYAKDVGVGDELGGIGFVRKVTKVEGVLLDVGCDLRLDKESELLAEDFWVHSMFTRLKGAA